MPKRTNKRQEIIALLRRALTPECEIEESAMLTDAVTGDHAEVDIVMRCPLEDLELVVSFEIVAWSRKAGRPWVHEQMRKHRDLPTEKLVLVSWSGFTGPAERAAQTAPHVTLMTPQTVVIDGVPKVHSLGVAEAKLSPTRTVLTITKPDGSTARIQVRPENTIFDTEGNEIGQVSDLAEKLVRAPWVGKRVLQDAINHPEREALRSFVLGVPFDSLEWFLREEPTQELHSIIEAEITGELRFKYDSFDLTVARLGEVLFGYGETSFGGRSALLATRINDDESIGAGTMRLYGDHEKP